MNRVRQLRTYKSVCTYQEEYIWVPFLDPEDIKILSLGAIWNYGKGKGLSWADVKIMGHKGPVYKA
jgi:hypothetical protein